ncbi:hypothetical protein [Mycobacterium sp. DL440]|uniref:CDGP domain-containing protein n=1 Tax=Mycobacterium sp. DL440 TaxID=2675523 RepID=UPI001FBB6A02|nr:hypothetical protein [Mycobacterium sp. DL440]
MISIKRLLAAMAAGAVLAGTGTLWATEAKADPGVGCETIRWGFLGSQRRTICDTPRLADGSWMRARVVWTPAGWVRGYCSFGTYYSSCSQGYYREETLQAKEVYPVNDGNVLPDEPGWLPTGSDVIR